MQTEDTLIEGARRGDNDAIGQLFDRHWRDSWRVAYGIVRSRETADEVAQDAFMAAGALSDQISPGSSPVLSDRMRTCVTPDDRPQPRLAATRSPGVIASQPGVSDGRGASADGDRNTSNAPKVAATVGTPIASVSRQPRRGRG